MISLKGDSNIAIDTQSNAPMNLQVATDGDLLLRVQLPFWSRVKILFGSPVLAQFKNVKASSFTIRFDV
jgi:hypothetical protein